MNVTGGATAAGESFLVPRRFRAHMAWVKAEYAGELAVVSAWIAALTPWSLTFNPNAPAGSWMFVVRLSVLELQIRLPTVIREGGDVIGSAASALAATYPGVGLFWSAFVTDPVSAALFYEDQSLVLGSVAWALGALVVVLAVALSIWLYRDEAAVRETLPYDEVRTMGVLLAAATALFGVATVAYFLGRDVVGVPVPLGVVVVGALAATLLRIERV